MRNIIKDLKFAIRIWLKRPAFAVAVVLTLAIGIGANTAIFSVVQSVLLSPLPLPESDRLVTFWISAPTKKLNEVNLTPGLFSHIRERTKTLERVAAYETRTVSFTGSGEPEQLNVAAVTADYFKILGRGPMLGRTFLSDEDVKGKNQVAVLSYELWQRRFGGADITGRALTFDNQPIVVVGVMPQATNFPHPAEQPGAPPRIDVWVPLTIDPNNINYWNYLTVGRLKPGYQIDDARREIGGIWSDFYRHFESQLGGGALGADAFVVLISLQERIVGSVKLPLILLLTAVGLVLLIACANIANLLLARATSRSREMAVRRCLGATRRRIVQQLMVESVLMSAVGGSLGLLLAAWGVGLLRGGLTEQVPFIETATLKPQVLLFTLGVSLLTGVLFGLAPAVRGVRSSLQDSIKQGVRVHSSRSSRRLGDALVISQIALSLVLLIGAMLLARSFKNLTATDPGFVANRVLSATVSLPESRYTNDNEVQAFYDQLMDRVSHLAGVESAGLSDVVPFSGGGGGYAFTAEGYVPRQGEPARDAWRRSVAPSYFDTMGIKLVRGRQFDNSDTPAKPLVTIVDEKLARQYWPDGDAVGKRIKIGGQSSTQPWLTIVGVVRSVKNRKLDEDAKFYIYQPFSQWKQSEMSVVVRTSIEPTQIVSNLRREVAALDSTLPVFDVATVEENVRKSVGTKLLASSLLTIFAITALVLAVIGIYGVISLNVSNRINEFGVRMALGARPGNIRGLVIRDGLRVAVIGAAAGLVAAFLLTRLIQNLLFGVSPTDPLTFVVVTSVLTIAALVASYIPARRATKVDPLAALRYE